MTTLYEYTPTTKKVVEFLPVRTGCSESSYKRFAPDQGLWEGSLPSAGITIRYLRIANAHLALWRKRDPHKICKTGSIPVMSIDY
jgi:hypothetical protein